jgi:hypothetical protein
VAEIEKGVYKYCQKIGIHKFQFVDNFERPHTKRIPPVLNDPSNSISIPCKIRKKH